MAALSPEQARINGKLGGRPPGKKTEKVLERERVLDEIRQRTMKVAHQLVDSQMLAARGQKFLYVKKPKLKPQLVTDPDTISAYLNGDLDDVQGAFYYITIKEPDTNVIDSMLDRAFGKATQKFEEVKTEDSIDDKQLTKIARRITDGSSKK